MQKSMISQIKIGATVLVLGAIALQLWQLLAPLPAFLQPVAKITLIVLAIHAIEALVSALLILLYKLNASDLGPSAKTTDEASALLVDHLPKSLPAAVIKAGLYVFFVGTVGLKEVIEGTRSQPAAEN